MSKPALSDFKVVSGCFITWLDNIVAGAMVHADIVKKGIEDDKEKLDYINSAHSKYRREIQEARKAK